MHYVYILKSKRDGKLYTGYSSDLRKRLSGHNAGISRSTKGRRPFILIYYEACCLRSDALRREKYLKTAWGKRYIKSRLRSYLMG